MASELLLATASLLKLTRVIETLMITVAWRASYGDSSGGCDVLMSSGHTPATHGVYTSHTLINTSHTPTCLSHTLNTNGPLGAAQKLDTYVCCAALHCGAAETSSRLPAGVTVCLAPGCRLDSLARGSSLLKNRHTDAA